MVVSSELSHCDTKSQEHGVFSSPDNGLQWGFTISALFALTLQVLVKHRLRAKPDFPDHWLAGCAIIAVDQESLDACKRVAYFL